ncbi:hypothetical protein Pla123a_17090 [Posidoniimonas polymericola]|uniref:Uncharacterized protein n=1 Tax=Posidoniimonas polymericola TaxID=2528002 RepID=A0A5C5YT07_9BACT|nr:hypothetical protein [Posidoniimonas polymericola]TWT77910.1 hypothetical protein Pla123a_17090 [Posidoniimonas polymericola]
MIARLPSLLSTLLLVFGPLATLSSAWMPHCLDPVTTFTNGVPLPSTDPMRTHNVNYGPDEYRVGCVGGHYHLPCLTHALFPNDCCGCQPTPPDACRHRAGNFESIEAEGVVTLGNLPSPMFGGGGGGSVGVNPAAKGGFLGR